MCVDEEVLGMARSDSYGLFLSYGWIIMLFGILSCYCCLAPGLLKCYRNLTETRFSVHQADAERVRNDEARNESQRTTESTIPVVSVVDILDIEEGRSSEDKDDEYDEREERSLAVVNRRSPLRFVIKDERNREDDEGPIAEAHLVSPAREEKQGDDEGRPLRREADDVGDEAAPPIVSSGSVAHLAEMDVETDFNYETLRSLRGRGLRALRLR